MQLKLMIAVIATALATGTVVAQLASPPANVDTSVSSEKAQRQFAKFDKDGSGAITRDEAAGNKRLANRFDEIDLNKDGKLSSSELESHRAAKHAGQGRQENQDKQSSRGNQGNPVVPGNQGVQNAGRGQQQKFKAADTNGDGALSRAEADAGMSRLAMRFEKIDANRDAVVTREEMRAHNVARFNERFRSADVNRDGALSLQEAESGKVRRIAKNFEALDTNRDGMVSRAEASAGRERKQR